MANYHSKFIDNKQEWENFILEKKEANFLQSYNWGQFHKKLGKTIFYLSFWEGEKQIGACLTVKENAKRGKYLTIAGGPIIDWQNENLIEFFTKEVERLAKENDCDFIRMRPQTLETEELKQQIEKLKWQESPMHLTADLTLQLDLTLSEEDLLKQMRKNTRYEVRQAEKMGITVIKSKNPKDIEPFYKHQIELAQKHKFVPFSFDFLDKQFKTFVEDEQVLLFHSYLDKKLLASAFIIFYNGEAVYHYGISTEDNQKLPGAYACQWEAIKEAKNQGMQKYNFWGIAPKDDLNHRFAGVSLFKRGFGGEEVEYLKAHDLAVSSKYYLTKGFELIRKKVRNL
ncbi:aminoacyltransferase [Candidatus Beckwithbacteria bacterium]|nr:aminoacyltransferase [Candidatus Beckwithbacteria bacterium]